MKKTILSLFDYSGSWSKPYKDAGYIVHQVDIKLGVDIFEVMENVLSPDAERESVYGLIAAPPCTVFSASGARWWLDKETQPSGYESYHTDLEFENTVEHSILMVIAILEIIRKLKPVFWSLENPVGRLNNLVPELQPYGPWYFNPCDYGDPYTKKTGLWGSYNKPQENRVEPREGSKMWRKYGGKSEYTKTMRSITPPGFALAFFEANK